MTKNVARTLIPGDQVSVPISPRRVGVFRRGLITSRSAVSFTVRWDNNTTTPETFFFNRPSHFKNLTRIASR